MRALSLSMNDFQLYKSDCKLGRYGPLKVPMLGPTPPGQIPNKFYPKLSVLQIYVFYSKDRIPSLLCTVDPGQFFAVQSFEWFHRSRGLSQLYRLERL